MPTERLRLHVPQRAASGMGAAAAAIYKSPKYLSPKIQPLHLPLSFAVKKCWEFNLAGFTGNTATDKHMLVRSDPNTYLRGFIISFFCLLICCVVLVKQNTILSVHRPHPLPQTGGVYFVTDNMLVAP